MCIAGFAVVIAAAAAVTSVVIQKKSSFWRIKSIYMNFHFLEFAKNNLERRKL